MAPVRPWLLFSYRLPRQPSRLRLSAWRRLRRLGALAVHDAIWVLPSGAETREQVDWLAEEIEEQGGSALIWEAMSLAADQDEGVIRQFRSEAETRYQAIAAAAHALLRAVPAAKRRLARPADVRDPRRQLATLQRALRLERKRDYFRSQGWMAAEEALRKAAGVLGTGRDEPVLRRRRHVVGDSTPLSR